MRSPEKTRTASSSGRHRSTGIARPRFWERAEYYRETERLAHALAAAEFDDDDGAGDRNG